MISDRSKKAKRRGTDRRWTLLFIGDHGNVIALKRLKAIIMAAAFIFFSTICAGIILFFVNHDTIAKNKELQKFLEKSKTQIETLRHEKEVLMARLVIAESKAKNNIAESRKNQGEIDSTNPTAPKPQSVLKEPGAKKEPLEKEEQKNPPVATVAQPKPLAVETDKVAPVLSVAVEDFSISSEPNSENLNAQFKIKNTSAQSQPISGHAVVVLKGDDLPKQEWLVMPAVDMIGDIPSGSKGKTFSIQRFRTMNFPFKTPDHFDAFETAVVYVFLISGELLLEEDFPVTLPPPPAPEIKAPASQKPSSMDLPSKTPPALTPSYDDETGYMF
jgi:hypothetical protein